jgi:hypothetical protein
MVHFALLKEGLLIKNGNIEFFPIIVLGARIYEISWEKGMQLRFSSGD